VTVPTIEEVVWSSTGESGRALAFTKSFDYIVAAECMYISSMVRPLLKTIHALCSEKTTVLICGMLRRIACFLAQNVMTYISGMRFWKCGRTEAARLICS
jgi:hypothetical protein